MVPPTQHSDQVSKRSVGSWSVPLTPLWVFQQPGPNNTAGEAANTSCCCPWGPMEVPIQQLGRSEWRMRSARRERGPRPGLPGWGRRGRWARTLQALIHAPVDAQAVLLLLHAPLAAAVVEGLLFEGLHGAATLVLGLQAGRQAEVGLLARHALPQRAVLGAAALLLQALIAGFHAVQAVPAAHLRRQEHVCGWRGGSVSAARLGRGRGHAPGDRACLSRLLGRPTRPLHPGVHFPAQ